jgi:hypothetical protein
LNSGAIIYEEKKSSRFLIGVLLIAGALCFFAFIYQSILKLGKIGNNPAPSWVYLILFVFFAICLLIFKSIRIQIKTDEIIIGFNNFFFQRIKFKDIEKIEIDDKSYGGSGLRIRLIKGKFRITYNAGQPRLVISIKNKRKEIAFSTDNPDQVTEIVKSKIEE